MGAQNVLDKFRTAAAISERCPYSASPDQLQQVGWRRLEANESSAPNTERPDWISYMKRINVAALFGTDNATQREIMITDGGATERVPEDDAEGEGDSDGALNYEGCDAEGQSTSPP
eukprot:5048466-Pyramimonas_sp.AAC.1